MKRREEEKNLPPLETSEGVGRSKMEDLRRTEEQPCMCMHTANKTDKHLFISVFSFVIKKV